jgi:hypothetical protein
MATPLRLVANMLIYPFPLGGFELLTTRTCNQTCSYSTNEKRLFSKVHSIGEEVWDPPANGPTGDQRGGPAGAQDAWQRTPRLGPLKDDVEQQLAGKIE